MEFICLTQERSTGLEKFLLVIVIIVETLRFDGTLDDCDHLKSLKEKVLSDFRQFPAKFSDNFPQNPQPGRILLFLSQSQRREITGFDFLNKRRNRKCRNMHIF
jgi:hypothetical protein